MDLFPPPLRERFYYPDAVVFGRNLSDDSYQDEPVVIFEVLSKGTERIDK